MIFEALSKPEYLWRPSQAFRRLVFEPQDSLEVLRLPWGPGILARSSETIGRAIATQGVYDLPVTEAIFRLLDPGETALDVGANIGYMSFVLARATGPGGKVLAFEPNSQVLVCLRKNLSTWSSLRVAPIELMSIALSDRAGTASMILPSDFKDNEGTAKLGFGPGEVAVTVARLDEIQKSPVGLMKVDVEGHEGAVFEGGEQLLRDKQIRDIVFEEHDSFPARSHQILQGHGYCIYLLTRSTFRPLLLPAQTSSRLRFLPTNYLATANPKRAEARMKGWGWSCLS